MKKLLLTPLAPIGSALVLLWLQTDLTQAQAKAQDPTSKIEIVTTFDFPGAISTSPQKINEAGDIAGEINGSAGETGGFIRYHSGRFTAPITLFGDDVFTSVRGINKLGRICGFYRPTSTLEVAFYENTKHVTTFSTAGAVSNQLYDLNDANTPCGAFSYDGLTFNAFIYFSGHKVRVIIPHAVSSVAYGISNIDHVVGSYTDSSGIEHGFFRDAFGAVTPVDVPGATSTVVFGVNDDDLLVGRFADSVGTHGFVMRLPDASLVFDVPGAALTSLNGINNNGVICGSYVDISGIAHGLVARIRPEE